MNNPQAQIIVTYVQETTEKKTLPTSNEKKTLQTSNDNTRSQFNVVRLHFYHYPIYCFSFSYENIGDVELVNDHRAITRHALKWT